MGFNSWWYLIWDTSSLQAPPSLPALSTSGMGYSADYQPLSSYASPWKAQRLPSQQKVVNHAMHGHVFASENTTQGSRCRRNQAQASHGWANGDNKQGHLWEIASKMVTKLPLLYQHILHNLMVMYI
ncbi:hypothetical protein RHMOL_Rhmol05G0157800 [Rhododendron molle]|uniref:Uncharacterized protein n=1 Tax=Rhododendron molle TaxID=49168 RepID=A0ACC0NQY8_RHOML|nr:hypothetical protein RHMOL_Rhmol05G0157800 [Rhododendron molle]